MGKVFPPLTWAENIILKVLSAFKKRLFVKIIVSSDLRMIDVNYDAIPLKNERNPTGEDIIGY